MAKKTTTTRKNTPARQKAQKKYNSKPAQKKRRASRNKARRMMIKSGKASKGDGRDVHHKDGNPKNNSRSNLTATTKTKNRSFKRNKKAGKK